MLEHTPFLSQVCNVRIGGVWQSTCSWVVHCQLPQALLRPRVLGSEVWVQHTTLEAERASLQGLQLLAAKLQECLVHTNQELFDK